MNILKYIILTVIFLFSQLSFASQPCEKQTQNLGEKEIHCTFTKSSSICFATIHIGNDQCLVLEVPVPENLDIMINPDRNLEFLESVVLHHEATELLHKKTMELIEELNLGELNLAELIDEIADTADNSLTKNRLVEKLEELSLSLEDVGTNGMITVLFLLERYKANQIPQEQRVRIGKTEPAYHIQ